MAQLALKNLKSLFLISCLLLLPFLTLNSYPGWGDDWAHYLAQAKSIAENSFSNFQEYYSFTSEFSSFKNPTVTPWGYPMLASIIFKINENNLIGFGLQQIFFLFIFYFIFIIFLKMLLATNPKMPHTLSL